MWPFYLPASRIPEARASHMHTAHAINHFPVSLTSNVTIYVANLETRLVQSPGQYRKGARAQKSSPSRT